MSRSRGTTGVAIVVAVAAISTGTWALSRWQPFADEAHTIDWPKNVQPLVDYIQGVTDLQFRDSINFEYISQRTEYNTRVRPEAHVYTDDEQAALAIEEGVGRALGLWSGDASLADSLNAISTAEPRPVQWRADDNLVLINGRSEKASLSPSLRADLIVYLTQALIEQNFHLIERRDTAASPQEHDAVAALQVGVALWVHDQYVDDLSARDRDDYASESAQQGETYVDSVLSVPPTLKAIHIAFQILGPVFITALAEDDPAWVQDALSSRVPTAMDQISLPAAKYVRNDPVESVGAPPAPADTTMHYTDQLGPFRLFLMFATGLPANESLTASDGWGNDRYTVYQLNDSATVCTDIHIVADSPVDADRMEHALNGWALARPGAAGALVGRAGVNLYASVCDPGPSVQQNVADELAIEQYFGRANFIQQQAMDTGKPELAECVATDFFSKFTIEQFADESLGRELDAAYAAIQDECRHSI
ncbi:hypothetical protein BH10ACT2_BH10ACT2_06540 [soil metagenome]